MNITLLLCDDMLATSLTFPKELLLAASQLAVANRVTRDRPVFTNVHIDPSTLSSNLAEVPLKAQQTLADIDHTDLLILPALWRNPSKQLARIRAQRFTLKRLYNQGTRIAATGTGAWLLAETGLLKHRAATTHWFYLQQFKQRYPDLLVRDQHHITQADGLYCASSINSLVDLTIHLIGELYTPAIAKRVEQQFSPEVRQHYRPQVFIDGATNPHGDELISQAQYSLQEQLSGTVNLGQLAQDLGVSQRTLNRRFRQATGVNPSRYLADLRIDTAKDLLRKTNLTLADIAATCGFGSAAHLSTRFKKSEGSSPSTYRKSVKSKLFF